MRFIIVILLLPALAIAADVVTITFRSGDRLSVVCDGSLVPISDGYACNPAAANEAQINAGPKLVPIVIRRKTDTSAALRIEAPKSAKIFVNGAAK